MSSTKTMKSTTTTMAAALKKSPSSAPSRKESAEVGIPGKCHHVTYYQNKGDAEKDVLAGRTLFELCYLNKNSLTRVAFGQCSSNQGKDGGGCHHHREDTKKTSLITVKELERALETGEAIKAKINYEIRDCTVSRIASTSHNYFLTMGTRGRKPDEKKALTYLFDDLENPVYQIMTNANGSTPSASKKEILMLKCFAEIIQSQPDLAKKLLASSKEAVLKKMRGNKASEADMSIHDGGSTDDADADEADDMSIHDGGSADVEADEEEDEEEDDLAAMMAATPVLDPVDDADEADADEADADDASHGTMPALLSDPEDADDLSEVTMEGEEADEAEDADPDEEEVQAEEIEDDEGNTFALDTSTMTVYLSDGTEIGILKLMPRAKYAKIEYNDAQYIIAVPREIKEKEYYICYHTQNAFDPSVDMKHVGIAKEDKEGNVKLVKSPASSSSVPVGKKK